MSHAEIDSWKGGYVGGLSRLEIKTSTRLNIVCLCVWWVCGWCLYTYVSEWVGVLGPTMVAESMKNWERGFDLTYLHQAQWENEIEWMMCSFRVCKDAKDRRKTREQRKQLAKRLGTELNCAQARQRNHLYTYITPDEATEPMLIKPCVSTKSTHAHLWHWNPVLASGLNRSSRPMIEEDGNGTS